MRVRSAYQSHGGKRRFYARLELLVPMAVVLSALACYFREPLTTRQLVVTENDAGQIFRRSSFDDREENGNSQSVATPGRSLAWSCTLRLKVKFGYCGFGLNFNLKNDGRGLDLQRFDKVTFQLKYHGPGRSLRVAFKNRNPAYLAFGAPSFDKRSQASASVSQGEQDFEVPFDQLSVAQWWRDGSSRQSPELARVDLDNVLSLEVITGSESEQGTHRIQIKRIILEDRWIAAETWYITLALAWVLIIGGIMVVRKRETARWRDQLTATLQTTLDTIPHMVWSMDKNGHFHFNSRWEEFTGTQVSGGHSAAWFQLLHPDELAPVSDAWEECSVTGEPFGIECRIKHKSGDYRWVLARAVPAFNNAGAAERWYGTCTDIHDRVEAQKAVVESVCSERRKSAQLKWASEHDSLTELPNRRAFHSRLTASSEAACDHGAKLGLLLVDLDHFKFINDSFGHTAGDTLLRSVAHRIQGAVRRADFVSRIGGDEFAIIVDGFRSERDLKKLGDDVLKAIRAPLRIGQRIVTPDASIGGAVYPTHSGDAENFFETADAALYALKRGGRGGVKLFEQYMLADVKRAAVQLACAREVVADNRVLAFYQPQIELSHGLVVGFEALLRYRKTDFELGLPESLQEAFKDYELAAKIGEMVQRKVAQDIRSWIHQGLNFGRVSINAAPAEFLRDDYAERLLAILEQNKVPANCFDVEITEHALLDRGPEYVARALSVLKRNGVTVSLDDFGTGSSSLSHLRDFSVDHVKIDQTFVGDIDHNQATASLVGGVISLAHSLGLKVVAEGVETATQRELLRIMGCDVGQGHLFSKAIGPGEVGGYLAGQTTSLAAVG